MLAMYTSNLAPEGERLLGDESSASDIQEMHDLRLNRLHTPESDKEGSLDFAHASENSSPTGEGRPFGHLQWTKDEERRLVWKIDLLVMSQLVLSFLALQLDRGTMRSTTLSRLIY